MSVANTRDDGAENEAVARAMQEVLEAEAAATARIADSRRAAADSLRAARAGAEAIRRRADARIACLHARERERTEAAIEAAQHPDSSAASHAERSALIADAVARLAAELTS